jgi:hypothetical protein
MAIDELTPLLQCGRDPISVAEHAYAGRLDEHERSCPHCQDITADTQLAGRAAGALRDTPPQPPPALLPAIMRTVWSELRPGAMISLADPDTSVSAAAIGDLLRHELDQIAGFTVHSCRVEPAGHAAISVELTASAHYPEPLPGLAERCRRRLTAAIRDQFGLHAARVDIHFADLDQIGTAL